MKHPEVNHQSHQTSNNLQDGKHHYEMTEISLKNGSNNNKQRLNDLIEPQAEQNSADGGFHHLRYVIIIMAGFATGSMLFLRLAFSIAIISMVNHTALYEHADNATARPPLENQVDVGEFEWNNEIQQTILSGYMVAYTLPQFFATRWTMKYGLRRSIPIALLICAVSVLLTPTVAYWGWQWVLALRLLNGLGASPMFPSLMNTVEIWTAKGEKTGGLAIAQFSCNLIYSSTPLISGFLASMHWKWTFYIPASMVLVFCMIWYILVADNPSSSKWLSKKEYDHLIGNNAKKDSNASVISTEDKLKAGAQLPWYFMFTLSEFYPVLALWLLYCCTSGGFMFLMPPYLRRILEIPVEQIGLINFIVQIGSLFCMLWSGPATALFQRLFGIELSPARKMVTTLCTGVAVATFAYLGYAHSHLVVTIVLNRFFHQTNDTLFMATIMSQYGVAGVSGLVYSMCNTFGNMSTVFFCWAVGRFLDYYGSSFNCWSGVMYTIAGMNTVYILIYILFTDSKPVDVLKSKSGDNKDADNTRC